MGRPPKRDGERLAKNRTFRVRGGLDDRLQLAAAQAGRSVSEEIESRLERSFADEDVAVRVLGGSATVHTAQALATVMKNAAWAAAARGFAEPQVRETIRAAVDAVMAIHIHQWKGERIGEGIQTLPRMEHGKLLPTPPLTPKQLGHELAAGYMIFTHDPIYGADEDSPLPEYLARYSPPARKQESSP